MRKNIIYSALFISLSFVGLKEVKAQDIGIIPRPNTVHVLSDSLQVPTSFSIHSNLSEVKSIGYLKQNLFSRFQIFSNSNTSNSSFISFELLKRTKNDSSEGYKLSITQKGIKISAADEKGFFNGINSLLQLFHFYQNKGKIKLPLIEIKDNPSFEWRGFMLDEARHFFGKEKVKQLLDYMAFYKLNKFHWHLTDEPAWRIEIKQYPYLTLVGGVGTYLNPLTPAAYYTQADIKEIVAYAAERYIDVIPEIDMPGHATAANRAYPQFSGGGTKDHPDFTFHPAKEGTYKYLTNILKEVSLLFPSNLVHLGGDEVSFGSEAWNADKSIQDLKIKYNLKSNKDVELYFMKRMSDSLFNMGSKLVVWDEMAEADLPRDKTIQYWWRHDKMSQFDLLMKNGYSTVICPRIPFYFDFVQSENHKYGRKWGSAYNPLQLVYDYDLESLKAKQIRDSQILGVQANLWTERIQNTNRLDFLVFPRLAALAENAWTAQKNKDYKSFEKVIKKHLNIYKSDQLYYYDPFGNTNAEPKVEATTKKYIDNPE